MQITDVRIKKVDSEGKVLAVASITIDGVFVVHGLKVIEGNEGPFVVMPSKKNANGEFKDIAHPLDQTTRTEIETKVLDAFNVAE